MSIEIVLHPKAASRDDLRNLLQEMGYQPCKHLWNWPKGSLHFHWFERTNYLSYDGVEATIYPSSSDDHQLGACEWALHTHTRPSASPADKDHQDETIRAARAKFGGNFYNDWHGKNRYTRREPDGRDAVARGIYLAYQGIHRAIGAVRFAIPQQLQYEHERMGEAELATLAAALAEHDPVRVLYNALVPFALASLESFFRRCFKVLLRYDVKAQARLREQNRKIDMEDVIAIKDGAKSIEDVVADWHSFQNIASIHKAFLEWFGIDFRKIIRQRKRVGSSIRLLEDRLNHIIAFRHGVIHRMELDYSLNKKQIDDIFAAFLAIVEMFIEHVEKQRRTRIRD